MKNNNLDFLDLVKFILSIMIVAIHSSIFPFVLYPWLRIAVPLFFIISSYFFFCKMNKCDIENKKIFLKKYIIRLLKYYLFWFIFLFPAFLIIRSNWFASESNIILLLIRQLFFGSTFSASWFIMATILATVIIYFLSKKIDNKVMFFLFFVSYLFCVIVSSYIELFDGTIFESFYKVYIKFFSFPYLSFPIALIWILIGKIFAENKNGDITLSENIVLILLYSVCLFLEWRIVYNLNGSYNNDCYLFLLPLCYYIFSFIKNIKINLKYAKRFRLISTITYPFHASFVIIFYDFFSSYIANVNLLNILRFIIAIFISILFSLFVEKFENKKYFGFLKYSH